LLVMENGGVTRHASSGLRPTSYRT